MAEDTGTGRRIGPLPAWGWALLAGGGIGLVWFLRSRSGSSAAPADRAADSEGDPGAATTIVPVHDGISEQQFAALMEAIRDLQGEPSQPAPAPTPPPPPAGSHRGGGPVRVPHPPAPVVNRGRRPPRYRRVTR